MKPLSRHDTGRRSEEAAARFLTGLGWRVQARNWRCRGGELDIVAEDGGCLVFVEVRARRDSAGYSPEETIDARKMRRLTVAATAYLDEHPWDGECRFDVVAIVLTSTGHELRLIREAFIP